MGQIRTVSPRATTLGQLALSITATVAATLIVTGIQHEWIAGQPAALRPELTSGGKFAARVEALRAAADEAAPTIAQPSVPVLVSDASLHNVPLTPIEDPAPVGAPKAAEPTRAVKRIVHAEPRRHVADASVDVVPPRRSDNVAVEAVAPSPAVAEVGSSGLWTTTKGLYKQALWLGGTTLDRVNPMNLLP